MSTASAHGKIILFGEHAVVYGRPALAVPVTQVHADVEIQAGHQPGILIDAQDISLRARLADLPSSHPLRLVVEIVLQSFDISTASALRMNIRSTIPVASGLGSGAAVSVALIRALAAHLGRAIDDEQVNQLAYQVEKIHHGTPSGIDNTVITYNRPVYFIKGLPIETLHVNTPFTVIIADTGFAAPTRESVADVKKLWSANSGRWELVFDRIGDIAQQARQVIENGKWQALGALMDANQALLQEMTVSSLQLDRLVMAAKMSGALGAKLSGGGRGGNMIALVNPEDAEKVSFALISAGARSTITTVVK
jgi:mevalonate kinase